MYQQLYPDSFFDNECQNEAVPVWTRGRRLKVDLFLAFSDKPTGWRDFISKLLIEFIFNSSIHGSQSIVCIHRSGCNTKKKKKIMINTWEEGTFYAGNPALWLSLAVSLPQCSSQQMGSCLLSSAVLHDCSNTTITHYVDGVLFAPLYAFCLCFGLIFRLRSSHARDNCGCLARRLYSDNCDSLPHCDATMSQFLIERHNHRWKQLMLAWRTEGTL